MNPPPSDYDHVIVSLSGGKDSVACVLHILEQGYRNIELWHQGIDGRTPGLMDWPVTLAYTRAFADVVGLPLLHQWREGGFEGEMLRKNSQSQSVTFQHPDGSYETLPSSRSKMGTRLQFPQVSADLSVRWCSAYLKIDVAARAINNSPRFNGKKVLYVTGERREESSARAKYLEFEPHRCHSRSRHVDHWRPVIDWDEAQVWESMRRHRIRPHIAYYLGFGRLSCMKCIFLPPDLWAAVRELDASGFGRIAEYETRFGKTIKRGMSVVQQADKGRITLPRGPERETMRNLALGQHYPVELVRTTDDWTLPAGAFKNVGGPT